MAALDALNGRFGRNALRPGGPTAKPTGWSMRAIKFIAVLHYTIIRCYACLGVMNVRPFLKHRHIGQSASALSLYLSFEQFQRHIALY